MANPKASLQDSETGKNLTTKHHISPPETFTIAYRPHWMKTSKLPQIIPIMRLLKYMVVTMCCLVAVSCFEVNEEITIHEDGSGVYDSKMDMSQFLEMMAAFAGEEEIKKEGLDRAIDTTIMLGDVLDSAENLTAEQKALLKPGKVNLQMNVDKKLMKIDMNVPYKDANNLKLLLQGGGSGGGIVGQVFKEAFKKPGDSGKGAVPGGPQMDGLDGLYDVTISNGLISKKLNEEVAKALFETAEMEQLKQLSGTGMEMLYTTTIHLPRPVKNIDNAAFKISDDRKTVTLKYNLLDLIENPSKYSYTIEY